MDVDLLKKIDKILILAVSLLLVYWMLIIVEPVILSPLSGLYQWMRDFAVGLGYWGSFFFSLIGNATVLFPFPYIGFPFILGGAQPSPGGPFVFDPWLIGIVSGIGAAVGEMTGYLLGYAGGEFMEEEKRSVFRNYALRHPKSTPIVLWFLAVTPIPDDVLVIPLGAAKYPWWKVFFPQLLGKSMFLAAIAWSGRLGLSWIEEFVFANPLSAVSKSMEVIVILAVVLVLYLVVRLDWASRASNSSSQYLDDAILHA